MTGAHLPRRFYQRDALRLARALLGKVIAREVDGVRLAARLVEVEAYRGPTDRAAHTFGGRRTLRNEVMWGPAGHLYVYFVYGMHWCANVVAADVDRPEAVLLRAAEPIDGIEWMRARRGPRVKDQDLLRGPANLCRALGIDRTLNGADLLASSVHLEDARPVAARQVLRTPRIGVDYAGADALLPWRLSIRDHPAVSGRR